VDNQTVNSANIAAFTDAVRTIYSSRDIREYVAKESAVSNNPNGDYDILYQYSLSNDDYIIVAERSGNSALSLLPLDAAGNVITGAQQLNLVDGVNSPYVWDTGYRSDQDPINNQTMELAVVDVGLFGTTQNIFGLRVINNSAADSKILIASDDTFTNNVPNPNGTQLPMFTVVKFVEVDDGNSDSGDDFYIPGTDVIYRIVITNSGEGSPDLGTFIFTDDLPDEVDLFVGDYAGSGSGPVDFTEGSTPSGLTYSFTNLSDAGDSITFRNSGGTSIAPNDSLPATPGYDPSVRSFEISSPTNFAPWSGSGAQPSFTIEYRVRLK